MTSQASYGLQSSPTGVDVSSGSASSRSAALSIEKSVAENSDLIHDIISIRTRLCFPTQNYRRTPEGTWGVKQASRAGAAEQGSANPAGDPFHGCKILTAPGLLNSGAEHWHSAWERRYPDFQRVEQEDWKWPRLDAWAERIIESAQREARPVVIAAHSFGCMATIRAAILQPNLIAGALLVAPPNPARFNGEGRLPPLVLPFPSLVVASTNDPFMPFDAAREWAGIWGAKFHTLARAGHINQRTGFRQWPTGLDLLSKLCEKVREPEYVAHRKAA